MTNLWQELEWVKEEDNEDGEDKDFKHYDNAEATELLNKMKDKKEKFKYKKMILKKIGELNEIKVLPKKGETIKLITFRQFNAFSFVQYIFKKENITDMYIAVYSIDNNTIKALKELSKIIKITILISTIRKNTAVLKDKLLEELKNEGVNIIYCWSHAKIIACKTEKDNYYIIEGSGNFSQNARIEQYSFENNKKLFKFHKSWIEEIEKK